MRFTILTPIPVNSTLLASVAYDAARSLLELEFRDGAIYQYTAVPESLHRDLMAAESHGAYFNQHIRNRFNDKRIRPPKATC
jgi:lysyl-tRNA synthetase class 2